MTIFAAFNEKGYRRVKPLFEELEKLSEMQMKEIRGEPIDHDPIKVIKKEEEIRFKAAKECLAIAKGKLELVEDGEEEIYWFLDSEIDDHYPEVSERLRGLYEYLVPSEKLPQLVAEYKKFLETVGRKKFIDLAHKNIQLTPAWEGVPRELLERVLDKYLKMLEFTAENGYALAQLII